MPRCKACDVEIDLTYRSIEIMEDEFITIEEDMCSKCIEAAKGGYTDEEDTMWKQVEDDGKIGTE